VTFGMNNGWAKTGEHCARLIIYKTPDQIAEDPIYHPTLVGEDFLLQKDLRPTSGRTTRSTDEGHYDAE